MSDMNTRILLANRPEGAVSESDFRIEQAPIPVPGDGEVLVRNLWLSVDPYMRGRMSTARSYATPVEIGDVMVGGTVGEVIDSRSPDMEAGAIVVGMLGWQTHAVANPKTLKVVPPDRIPLSAYLGVAGMPGVTAWVGLEKIGQPKDGETVVVSAAAGAVGGVVGQLAKIRGARAVGIAGGQRKVDYVTWELGFDACVDYKGGRLEADLASAVPSGIDVYWENVGGAITDAVFKKLNAFARIPLCGLISRYNDTSPAGYADPRALLVTRSKIQGFIVTDWPEVWPRAIEELTGHIEAGRLKYRESVAEGIESTPKAFVGLFSGSNIGKQVVRLAT